MADDSGVRVALDAARWDAVEEAAELLLAGEQMGALERLKKVLEEDPQNSYGFFYLGTAMFELGKLAEAREAYLAAIRLSNTYLAARVSLSHTLRLLDDGPGAIKAAKDALKLFPDDGDVLYALALGHAAGGENKAAIKAFKRYLGTGPEAESQVEVQGIIDLLSKLPEGEALDWD